MQTRSYAYDRCDVLRDGETFDRFDSPASRADGIAYLVADAPYAAVPCSRYGSTSHECAPVAWRVAYLVARESSGDPVTYADLDYAMSLVVNDSEDVAYLVRTYGNGHYR